MQQHEEMCVMWSEEPFGDRAMAMKSLKEVMVESKNSDLHHVFVVYNKLSIFITQAIWPFKYMHYSDTGICIMVIEFDTTRDATLWERMNALMTTTIVISNRLG